MSLIATLSNRLRCITRIGSAIKHSSSTANFDSRYEVDIKVEQKDNVTYVEGELIEPKGVSVTPKGASTACALCRLNLKNLNYTDVLILSQFIERDGSVATYHESKLCSKQYRKIIKLIDQAQRCNLLPRPADYLSPGPWHDLNTYLENDRKRDQPMKVIKKEYWKL